VKWGIAGSRSLPLIKARRPWICIRRWNCSTEFAAPSGAIFADAPDHRTLNSPTPPAPWGRWFNWVQLRRNYSSAKHLIVPHPTPVLLLPTSTMHVEKRAAGFLAARRPFLSAPDPFSLSFARNLNYFHDGRGHTLSEQSRVVGRVTMRSSALFAGQRHALTMFLLIVLLWTLQLRASCVTLADLFCRLNL
jgi:hypothetical protein